MCKMCDMREEYETKHKELEFRFVQLQVELEAEDRADAAKECEARIFHLCHDMFRLLRKRQSMSMMEDDISDLNDVLNKALN